MDNCASKMLGISFLCSILLHAVKGKGDNWRVRPLCVLANIHLEGPVSWGDSLWILSSCVTQGLDFLSGPWNGKKILGSRSALYLYDIFPGCYAHLCSISYLFRSLHEGHVPSAAVWLSGRVLHRSVERDGWSSTAATWPVPARRCRIFAKLQHQQFAEIDQQPSRLQPADHLAALGHRAGQTSGQDMGRETGPCISS